MNPPMNNLPGQRKPRLLYLACYFPPVSTSGAVRARNTAKYLSRLGWDVTVATFHPSLVRVDRDPSSEMAELASEGIRYIHTGHHFKFMLPVYLKQTGWLGLPLVSKLLRKGFQIVGISPGFGWILPALTACWRSKGKGFDLILATGTPFESFVVAAAASKWMGCPYVLDFRDPWTDGPHHPGHGQYLVKRLEKRLVRKAAALVTVSPSWAAAMDHNLDIPKKFQVVPNGYDEDEGLQVAPMEFTEPALVYAGVLYPPKRVLTPVLEALKLAEQRMASDGPAPVLHYFGLDGALVEQDAIRCGCSHLVRLHGPVPRDRVLSAIKGSHLALVVTSVSEQADLWEAGTVTGKIFEPLNLGTRVLLIAPPRNDARQIVETLQGGMCFHGGQIEAIADYLVATCSAPRSPAPQVAKEHSWEHIVVKLNELLKSI